MHLFDYYLLNKANTQNKTVAWIMMLKHFPRSRQGFTESSLSALNPTVEICSILSVETKAWATMPYWGILGLGVGFNFFGFFYCFVWGRGHAQATSCMWRPEASRSQGLKPGHQSSWRTAWLAALSPWTYSAYLVVVLITFLLLW